MQQTQFTGSQESIIQLDMDTEDGGDENQNDEISRARSVSPSLMVQLDHEVSSRFFFTFLSGWIKAQCKKKLRAKENKSKIKWVKAK